ncbi:MAG: ATP-grasp domain-containing protein [Planctomycetia bacterium]|nr:ATP-grasp domain-containing protein [Planctomycetia bacterium]
MIHFLFPRDSADPHRPDEIFADQWAALTEAGFSASLCSDATLAGTKPLRDVPAGCRVVYRGWTLKREEYESLVRVIEQCGATAFTQTKEYLLTHHLPNWYPLIPDLTPETRVYPVEADLVAELQGLGWGAYFIKDYVKSLKTARGAIVREPSEVTSLIAEMREYRGEIEGGICVRRFEEFVPASEKRYFVLRGVASAAEGLTVPNVVKLCAERIHSDFFSVDVARRQDGAVRVVEVGDGQVSDLVGWSATAFAKMWLRATG